MTTVSTTAGADNRSLQEIGYEIVSAGLEERRQALVVELNKFPDHAFLNDLSDSHHEAIYTPLPLSAEAWMRNRLGHALEAAQTLVDAEKARIKRMVDWAAETEATRVAYLKRKGASGDKGVLAGMKQRQRELLGRPVHSHEDVTEELLKLYDAALAELDHRLLSRGR